MSSEAHELRLPHPVRRGDHSVMTTEARRADVLRVAGWILGVLGALLGVAALLLALPDGHAGVVSAVGVAGGSCVSVLCAIIIDHKPTNRAAWALLAGGWLLAADSLGYSWAVLHTQEGSSSPVVAATAFVVDTVAGESLPLFLLLFPDGRLPSKRWRPVLALYLTGWAATGAAAAMAVWPSGEPIIALYVGGHVEALPARLGAAETVTAATDLFGMLFLLVGIAAVAVRLRRARGTGRTQLLWAAWGLGVTVAIMIAATAASGTLKTVLAVLAPLPFYAAITVAMRRHQLFDVQRLIRRTVTYTAISAFLLGLYAMVAVGVGAIAGQVGAGSSVAVAAATLAVAAAFRPALRLVRAVVDQRFDRRTWLAVQALEAFTGRLRAGTAAPADLLAALRQAVDDPTARVAYVEDGQSIDLDGSPADLGDPQPGRLRRQVTAGGSPVAVVDLDARLAEEPRLVQAALAAAALPLENAALHARAAVRLADVRASRSRIVAAEDSQRRRIERDLHDGVQQRLVALALRLRIAEREVTTTSHRAATVLGEAVEELRATVDELRELTRGILPPVLTDEGLAVALRTAAARLPLPVTLDVTTERFPPTIEATCWYVAGEAMANAVKHADAATVRLSVHRTGDSVVLQVDDDGAGGAGVVSGGGLQGLSDRVAAVGGRFTLTSPSGAGTRLTVELPCAS
ncbi:histidine kinase [Nonomuraea sp. NBC_00507]|uniref:sensor histidine kinase n=1 Tax=Nonomuraea sp. NBC_00507 TaxID=2976002 RepID=UPI002E19DF6B